MTRYATTLQPATMGHQLSAGHPLRNGGPNDASVRPTADVLTLPTSWQPARYGEGQRPNPFAMIGAVAIVGVLLAALLTVNIVQNRKVEAALTVVSLRDQPTPPPPPPPARHQPKPVEHVQAPSPVIAPPPLVVVPSAPALIATTPTPPPPAISTPGPSSPKPQAAPPSIESAGDLASTMISARPPRYPQVSRRKNEQGVVVLMVLVGTDGNVATLSVQRSSGFERLDQAALEAVRSWRWAPARSGGAPVMVRGFVDIPFILKH